MRGRSPRRSGLRSIQAPDIDQIEVEVRVSRGTIRYLPIRRITGTVIPQMYLVDILQSIVFLCLFQRCCERGSRVLEGACSGDREVGEVGFEEVVVVEGPLVPARDFDEGDADQAGEGEDEGGEDAGYAAFFTIV